MQMTTCGWACLYILGALSMIGIIAGAMHREKKDGAHAGKPAATVPARDMGPAYTPPVVFRQGEDRIVTCKASTDMRRIYFEGLWGVDEPEKRRSAGLNYAKKELAALLAEQALAAGGIRFYQQGGELRAELRALVREEAQE